MLREFFTADLTDYLFSPARAVEEILAARSEARKTPRFPSHIRRNAAKRVKPRPDDVRDVAGHSPLGVGAKIVSSTPSSRRRP